MRSKILLFALALVVVRPVLGGCNETQRTQREYKKSERLRKKAMTEVRERSSDYMNALRWRDFQAASGFFESVEDQTAYLQRMADGIGQSTVETISIDYVLVDKEAERAEVHVTLSEVEYVSQRLQTRTQTLLWYLSDLNKPKQWYLVPTVMVEPE